MGILRLFLRKGGWVALPFLLAAAMVGAVWFHLSANARALHARGVVVKAEVLVLRIDEPLEYRSNSSTGRRTRKFEAIVGFTLDGTRHQARQAMSQGFFETLTPRVSVPVRVLPDDPGIFEIEPGAASGNAGAAFWIAVACGLTGALVAALSWRLARRIDRLRRRGIPRTARVTDVRPIGSKHRVQFRWHDANGTPRQGHSQPRRLADGLADLAPGDPLPVAEDPGNPALAMWLRDLDGPRMTS